MGFPKIIAWLKSASISYHKPGYRDFLIHAEITPKRMQEIIATIRSEGKVVTVFDTEVFDVDGELCVVAQNEVYVRDLNFDFSQLKKS